MNWQDKILNYCKKYNIPLDFLSDTLDEPKVIPMIRGKAFEFTVYEKFLKTLDSSVWKVDKPNMNAQIGFHDIDTKITHIKTNKTLSIECKLASKGSCQVSGTNTQIKVKCMRSRTLGEEMVKRLSPIFKIPEKVLMIHNDQYLETDFDFVVTSIGNAFYQTDVKGTFFFSPDENQKEFLKNFPNKNIQEEAFNCLYIASAKEISIKPENNEFCTRQKCQTKNSCKFIPNYPVIRFNTTSLIPLNNWHEFKDAHQVFLKYLKIR